MNTYETARDLLAAADVANQRFHAYLRVCKVRSSYEKTGMLNRMAAHASFPSFSEQRKQYKYFTHLMIQHVREMNQLKRSFYSGAVNERPETSGGILVVRI
ncbi:hypothetical protein KIN20_032765 [Parelaphostrongylus tenuis]|uniref:Uncharacterized protein n=1 Tax=Parelaphostrongylus tenuis TaxID=148309 RepID=A0AAD5R7J8_PARTN|nr:hypothetical protein KIN20_032765 [Parelaphostrongylus tenuis]